MLPISSCTSERFFLALNGFKNYLLSTFSNGKIISLDFLIVENVSLESILWDECIDQFAKHKSRKAFL